MVNRLVWQTSCSKLNKPIFRRCLQKQTNWLSWNSLKERKSGWIQSRNWYCFGKWSTGRSTPQSLTSQMRVVSVTFMAGAWRGNLQSKRIFRVAKGGDVRYASKSLEILCRTQSWTASWDPCTTHADLQSITTQLSIGSSYLTKRQGKSATRTTTTLGIPICYWGLEFLGLPLSVVREKSFHWLSCWRTKKG